MLGAKADMALFKIKLCVATSERFSKANWYLNALYKCPGLLYFTYFTSTETSATLG